MFSAASVCLFVCHHDSFRTSKHRMMKLGVGALCKNLGQVRMWGVIAPLRAHPPPKKNVALGYDVGKINAGCLVFSLSVSLALRLLVNFADAICATYLCTGTAWSAGTQSLTCG